jgi:hypothetical protein
MVFSLWASVYAENVCDGVKKEVDDTANDGQRSQPEVVSSE